MEWMKNRAERDMGGEEYGYVYMYEKAALRGLTPDHVSLVRVTSWLIDCKPHKLKSPGKQTYHPAIKRNYPSKAIRPQHKKLVQLNLVK